MTADAKKQGEQRKKSALEKALGIDEAGLSALKAMYESQEYKRAHQKLIDNTVAGVPATHEIGYLMTIESLAKELRFTEEQLVIENREPLNPDYYCAVQARRLDAILALASLLKAQA